MKGPPRRNSYGLQPSLSAKGESPEQISLRELSSSLNSYLFSSLADEQAKTRGTIAIRTTASLLGIARAYITKKMKYTSFVTER